MRGLTERATTGDERRDEVQHVWVNLAGGDGEGRYHIKGQNHKRNIKSKFGLCALCKKAVLNESITFLEVG